MDLTNTFFAVAIRAVALALAQGELLCRIHDESAKQFKP
jgi:hypothetical protein